MRMYPFLLIFIFTMSGCSLPFTGKRPAEYSFRLVIGESGGIQRPQRKYGSLRLSVVNVGLGLQTDRIMARDGMELLPVIGARWVETSAGLIEKTFAHYLTRRKVFASVATAPSAETTDFVLELDLREFYLIVEDNTPSHVKVSVFAHLINTESGATIVSDTFAGTVPLETANVNGAITAFGGAAGRVMADIVDTFPD